MKILIEESVLRQALEALELTKPRTHAPALHHQIHVAAIAALRNILAPSYDATKWQLVPVEPTEEMQEAMLKANIYPPHQPDGSVSVKAQNLHIYKAMLSAAPKMSEDV